jgi:hypothetical protein
VRLYLEFGSGGEGLVFWFDLWVRHNRAGSEGERTRSLLVAYNDARSALRLSWCYWIGW